MYDACVKSAELPNGGPQGCLGHLWAYLPPQLWRSPLHVLCICDQPRYCRGFVVPVWLTMLVGMLVWTEPVILIPKNSYYASPHQHHDHLAPGGPQAVC